MNKVKEYIIVRGYTSEVEKAVNLNIEEGWQPFGPLAACHRHNSTYPIVFQAMVKYDKD